MCGLNACNYSLLKVGRIKQKRGYKDQWPWNIKIYADEFGNNKGDACLAYEDPSAAHAAGGFYNSKFGVEFAVVHDILLFNSMQCCAIHNAYILFIFQILTREAIKLVL